MPPRSIALRSALPLVFANAVPKLFASLVAAAPTTWQLAELVNTLAEEGTEPEVTPGSAEFYLKLAFSAFLVLSGGLFAGLTIGLLSLDEINLQVMSEAGSDSSRKHAAKVLRLLKRGRHWVLVTLLLSNVVVNESLPVFLDSVIGGGILAVVFSTAAIVIFGEVIPQSVCARWGLQIGAACAPFVFVLMIAVGPIAWPIAKLLDYLLGEDHGTLYRKGELKTFVGLHKKHMMAESALSEDEVTIISSVLDLHEKPIKALMTPIDKMYSLPGDTLLDKQKVDEILSKGHSRVPVYSPGDSKDFIGMLIVKKLISYDPHEAQRIDSFRLSILPETAPDVDCFQILNYFQKGRSHMLLISNTPGVCGGAIGCVTLEDVIEEIIAEEIMDETDVYESNTSDQKILRQPPTRPKAVGVGTFVAGIVERRKQNTFNANDSTAPAGVSAVRPHLHTRATTSGGGSRAPSKTRQITDEPEVINETQPLLANKKGTKK